MGGDRVTTQATGTALAAEAAGELIRQYLGERQPRLLAEAEIVALSGDASTRRYYRLLAPGTSYVLALYPEAFVPEELSYLTVRGLFESYGLPVPLTVDVDGTRGVVLQQDLGDLTLQEVLKTPAGEASREALYREAVDQVARLQLRAAQGPQKADCFRIAFDIEKLTWELHYFQKHFLEGYRAADPSVEDRAVLGEAFHQLCQEIASWPRVVCHRDYHSRNLMLHGESLYIIDFQDARMGPDTYDLVSLLRDSYVDLNDLAVNELIAYFLALKGGTTTEADFRPRFDLMALQRNMKALGTFGYQTTARGNPVYIQYMPRTLRYVRDTLHRYPRFSRLHELLSPFIDELR